MLTTDDAERLRTVTGRCNEGSRYGHSDGNRVCVRRCEVEGIPQGWAPIAKEKLPDGQEEMYLAFFFFFGNVVLLASMNDEAVEAHPVRTSSIGEAHLFHTNNIWDLPDVTDDTPILVTVCLLTWEKRGEMAVPKVRIGTMGRRRGDVLRGSGKGGGWKKNGGYHVSTGASIDEGK